MKTIGYNGVHNIFRHTPKSTSELQAESRLLLSKLKDLIRDQTTIQVDVGETIQVTSVEKLGTRRGGNIEDLRSSEVYGDD